MFSLYREITVIITDSNLSNILVIIIICYRRKSCNIIIVKICDYQKSKKNNCIFYEYQLCMNRIILLLSE